MQVINLIKDKKILGFSLYDFSNSAYILIFNSYLFPIFFKEEVFNNSHLGDYYWGLSISVSVLLAVIISPIIGRFADHNFRKAYLITAILITFIGVLCLSTVNPIYKSFFIACFILTNISYIVSLSLYDSILPHITTKENVSLVSSFAWGMGYLGGVICFLVVFILQEKIGLSHQNGFLFTGVFYLIFSLMSLKLLPSKYINTKSNVSFKVSTLKLLSKNIIILLIAFWLISDAIDTIIHFASLYGRETLNISTKKIGVLLLGLQIVAFPATIFMGYVAKKLGEKNVIIFSLIVWLFISGSLMISTNFTHMLIVIIVTAFVIGTTQSLMRSYYSRNLEKENSSFSFGVYSIVTRASALLGPLIFGIISSSSKDQQLAMISVFIPLLVGGSIFALHKFK